VGSQRCEGPPVFVLAKFQRPWRHVCIDLHVAAAKLHANQRQSTRPVKPTPGHKANPRQRGITRRQLKHGKVILSTVSGRFMVALSLSGMVMV